MKVNKQNAAHYLWGEINQSWKFLSDENMNVHLEIIEPASGEVLHFHKQASQFFYVIEGKANFVLEDQSFLLNEEEGIKVEPNQAHLIKNTSDKPLKFLVVTSPYSTLDRFNVGEDKPVNDHLNNRKFKALANSPLGEVSSETIFHYRQKEHTIWATYEGGEIQFGTLSGIREGNSMHFRYQHLNLQNEWKSGQCSSKISIEHGKIRLDETWEWLDGDRGVGTSVLVSL